MELLSLGRMARRLGVTRQWLREAAEAGQLPCLRAGNRMLFAPLAVIEAAAALATRLPKGANDGK